MNRKYLIHVMAKGNWKGGPRTDGKRRPSGGRNPVYSAEFAAVLRSIWAFFWYRCGKILAPLIRENIRFLEEPFGISSEVKALLMTASPATVDRVLRADKKRLALTGKCGTKPGSLLKRQIPVRVYFADAEKKPGFFETDTVGPRSATTAGRRMPRVSSAPDRRRRAFRPGGDARAAEQGA